MRVNELKEKDAFISACTVPSLRKQCSLLYYMKKKIASGTADVDSGESTGNAIASHCFSWILCNVQETEIRPAACRSVVLLFCSMYTNRAELHSKAQS